MNLVAAVEWAEGYNRRGLYSPIGVAFHWVMAALMVFQLGYGWYLGWQPVGGDKYVGYQTHTQVGLTIMLLGTLRFFWHSQVGGPQNVDEASFAGRASRAAAGLVLFQLLRAADQRLGHVVDAAERPAAVDRRRRSRFPTCRSTSCPKQLQHRLMHWAATAHFWIVWITTLVIPGHAGAAVLHYVIKRDRVLPSMLDLNGPQEPGVVGSAPDKGSAA